jgi:hypothetical protein
MDWRHIAELIAAARATGLEMLNLCVWTKPNAGMGVDSDVKRNGLKRS